MSTDNPGLGDKFAFGTPIVAHKKLSNLAPQPLKTKHEF